MGWLDRIHDRDTRRLAKNLQASALETGGLARDYAGIFARRTGRMAGRAAHRFADYGSREGTVLARQARGLAEDYGTDLAHRAGSLAGHAAHRFADYGSHEGNALARQAGGLAHDYAGEFAHRAGDIAGRAARQLADYGRHEGAIIAHEASVRAKQAGRAVRADPLPAVVGIIGVALLASLLFGRRH